VNLKPGEGHLVCALSAGKSRVVEARAASPLQWLTPKNRGHAAWVYQTSHGGGLVSGDTLDVRLRVQAGATAFVSTQSATKVYRCPQPVAAHLHAEIADRAVLVLAPDPVVCFKDAAYTQNQHITLAPSAGLILVDGVTAGRHGRGERWELARYASRTEIMLADRVLARESMLLDPVHGSLLERLGATNVLGLILIAGAAVAEIGEQVMAFVDRERAPHVRSAVSRLGADSVMVRIAAPSIEAMMTYVRAALSSVCAHLGDDPWARKW
jgi:urease accessory protein